MSVVHLVVFMYAKAILKTQNLSDRSKIFDMTFLIVINVTKNVTTLAKCKKSLKKGMGYPLKINS